MGEFFKGWRRKAGGVTLVLACVFMAGWIRSYSIKNTIVIEDAGFLVESQFGRIQWGKYGFEVPDKPIEWLTLDIRKVPPEYEDPDYRNDNQERSYWSIVIPLTLLSAYLLLSKPRAKIHVKPHVLSSP